MSEENKFPPENNLPTGYEPASVWAVEPRAMGVSLPILIARLLGLPMKRICPLASIRCSFIRWRHPMG